MKKITAVFLSVVLLVGVATISCRSKKGENAIQLSGTVGTGYVLAERGGLIRDIFTFSKKAYAAALAVDRIAAVSLVGHDLVVSNATLGDGTFSVSVDRDYPQLLVFLSGTTTVGIYRVDVGTDLDVFPLNAGSTNIDLGHVSLNGDRLEGTITRAELFQNININPDMATTYGAMDNEFMRLSSLDVDGNGVLDPEEGKYFDFRVSYEFKASQTLAEIQGAFVDPANVYPVGYFYLYHDHGSYNNSLIWSSATLSMPQAVDGASVWPQTAAFIASDGDGGATLNFGNTGHNPSIFFDPPAPPNGTCVITVNKQSGGTQTLTFSNFQSRIIDANMYEIYVPAINLTMSGGEISRIDWQWWKRRHSDGTWVQPDDQELSRMIYSGGFVLGNPDPSGNLVIGTIGITSRGSVVPTAQGFTPYFVRVYYNDKAGYEYGFDWR